MSYNKLAIGKQYFNNLKCHIIINNNFIIHTQDVPVKVSNFLEAHRTCENNLSLSLISLYNLFFYSTPLLRYSSPKLGKYIF